MSNFYINYLRYKTITSSKKKYGRFFRIRVLQLFKVNRFVVSSFFTPYNFLGYLFNLKEWLSHLFEELLLLHNKTVKNFISCFKQTITIHLSLSPCMLLMDY